MVPSVVLARTSETGRTIRTTARPIYDMSNIDRHDPRGGMMGSLKFGVNIAEARKKATEWPHGVPDLAY